MNFRKNANSQENADTCYLEGATYSDDGVKWQFDPPLEFINAFQCRVTDEETTSRISKALDGIQALGCRERVLHHWYAGDHDYPPEARKAAVDWFRRWLAGGTQP